MLSLVQEVVCWTRAGPSDNMCDCLDKIMICNHMTNLLKKLINTAKAEDIVLKPKCFSHVKMHIHASGIIQKTYNLL